MDLYLTIMEGQTPGEAEPLLATRDVEIIQLVARELIRRLGTDSSPSRVMDLVRKKSIEEKKRS